MRDALDVVAGHHHGRDFCDAFDLQIHVDVGEIDLANPFDLVTALIRRT